MSNFPAALRSAARSAYREVLRSARITFQGDPARHHALLTALRATFSSPTLTPPLPPASEISAPSLSALPNAEENIGADEIVKRITEWKEVAKFLRNNVVQGVKTENGSYKLRVHQHTELGDNASIKDSPKLPVTPFPNRNRKRCPNTASSTTG
ncbi:hypothetical protein L204_103443 [Cryptococcus depauperatus]|nr:hypothetical protein L204_01757 [Cryptococcus depauperatus CBS 7855]